MNVLTSENPELRVRSAEMTDAEIGSTETNNLIEELKRTMKQENGVGIAAPQVGIKKRLIIADLGEGPVAFINPKIIQRSLWKIESEEGCLSVPGVFGIVRRHKQVTVEAITQEGEAVTLRAEQFPAIVLQHEIDHLDGVLFIDGVVRYTSHPKI